MGCSGGMAGVRGGTQSLTARKGGHPREKKGRSMAVMTSASASKDKWKWVPNALTVSRVVMIPAFVAIYESGLPGSAVASTSIFLISAITDYLDGYLARKLEAASAFGKFLDPVADKLMVSAALVVLTGTQPTSLLSPALKWLLPVITTVIISREIAISALREWAASQSATMMSKVQVSAMGKWKTASQLLSLTLLLGARALEGVGESYVVGLGMVFLLIAASMTVMSGAAYIKAAFPQPTTKTRGATRISPESGGPSSS